MGSVDSLRQSQGKSGYLNQDVILNDFSGGYINSPDVVDPAQVPTGHAIKSINIDTSGKSIRKMKGFTTVTSAAVASADISSIFYDAYSSTVYIGYKDKLGYLNGTAVSALASSGTYTTNKIWSFARVNTNLLATNGTDAMQKWNGTAVSAVTTPPVTWGANNRPRGLVHWMGRAFAFDLTGEPDFLYFSKLYDGDDWTAGSAATDGGAIRIGNDGKAIKACYPHAKGLLIFKDPGLYLLSGSVTGGSDFDQTAFDWTLLSDEVDCRSHRALIPANNSVYAWGRQCVWQVKGSFELQAIEANIISSDISKNVTDVVNVTDQITTAHYATRNQIWFGVAKDSGSTTIDRIYCYDYANKQWFIREGYSHKCMADVRDSNGAYQIYSGGYSGNAYIFKQNTTNDFNGSAMSCQYWTGWVPMAATANARPGLVIITVGGQTNKPVSYSYSYDFASTPYDSFTLDSVTPTSKWTGSSGGSTWSSSPLKGSWQHPTSLAITRLIYGQGRRIQHRFYSNQVGSDFAILEIKHPATTIGYR